MDDDIQLFNNDCLIVLQDMQPDSVDVIFADPPYFLSNNGITCQNGKRVSVNKGNWDIVEDKNKFNRDWLNACYRVLKQNGSIWISGTYHNIYSVGYALEQENFKILNNITWVKNNPPPNLSCRCFTHSTETILWAKKINGKHYFNYSMMKELNGGKQMKDVWNGNLIPQSEKLFGNHPTQKPEYLLERIILASTKDNDIVLDPFSGSGTIGVICKKLGRKYIGIEKDTEYYNLQISRLKNA